MVRVSVAAFPAHCRCCAASREADLGSVPRAVDRHGAALPDVAPPVALRAAVHRDEAPHDEVQRVAQGDGAPHDEARVPHAAALAPESADQDANRHAAKSWAAPERAGCRCPAGRGCSGCRADLGDLDDLDAPDGIPT